MRLAPCRRGSARHDSGSRVRHPRHLPLGAQLQQTGSPGSDSRCCSTWTSPDAAPPIAASLTELNK